MDEHWNQRENEMSGFQEWDRRANDRDYDDGRDNRRPRYNNDEHCDRDRYDEQRSFNNYQQQNRNSRNYDAYDNHQERPTNRYDDRPEDQGRRGQGYDNYRPPQQNVGNRGGERDKYDRPEQIQGNRGRDYDDYERPQQYQNQGPRGRDYDEYRPSENQVSRGRDSDNYDRQKNWSGEERSYGGQQKFNREPQDSYPENRHQGNSQKYEGGTDNYKYEQNKYGKSQEQKQYQGAGQERREFHGGNFNRSHDRYEDGPNYSGKRDLARPKPWAPVWENLDFLAGQEKRRCENIDVSLDHDVRISRNRKVEQLSPATRFAQICDANTVENVCRILGYKELRKVQKEACPYILAGYDTFLRTASGSGKTATYLLPLIKKVIEEKRMAPRSKNCPYVIIVAPSLELVKHIYEVSRVLSAETSLSCGMIVGNIDYSRPNACETDVDILTGSPQKLFDLLLKQQLHLKSAISIVVDEADWYWGESLQGMLKIAQRTDETNRIQRIIVSSTFIQQFELRSVFDTPRTVTFENKEALPFVNHRFTRVNDRTMMQHLLHELYKDRDELYRSIIVATSRIVLEKTLQFLKDQKIFAKEYSTGNHNLQIGERECLLNEFCDNKFQIMVTTDNALLRGIRLPYVDKLIHLEAPKKGGSVFAAFHHRLSCIAFSHQTESIVLANVDDIHDINTIVQNCALYLSELPEEKNPQGWRNPDWMNRMGLKPCWTAEDRIEADKAPVRQEEREEEAPEETFGSANGHRREYNHQYSRRQYNRPWNQNRNNYGFNQYNNYNPGYIQQPQLYSQPGLQAIIGTTLSIGPTVVSPGTSSLTSDSIPKMEVHEDLQHQISQMYAGGSIELPPLFAPNQNVIFAGSTSFFPPTVPKAPVVAPLPKLGPGEKLYTNNDGFQTIIKVIPVPVEDERMPEDESVEEERNQQTPEATPVNPVDHELEATPPSASSPTPSPTSPAQEVQQDMEDDAHPEPIHQEAWSPSVLAIETETDCEESSPVVQTTPSDSLTSSFEKLACEDATMDENSPASGSPSI